MPESHTAPQSSLSYAKLVATPTDTAWAQVYNTGNLFICLALEAGEKTEAQQLQVNGKEFITALHTAFESLSHTDNATIKNVLQKTIEDFPAEVSGCLSLAFFKESTLHLFIAGSGKILMRRGEKTGVLLEKKTDSPSIISASGHLENGDTLMLQTGPFTETITDETITQALELSLPTDIVEAISPAMHEENNGGQAAIVITYRGASQTGRMIAEEVADEESTPPEEKTIESLYQEQEQEETLVPSVIRGIMAKHSVSFSRFSKLHFPLHMTHRSKLFLNIALILLLLLGASVFFTLKRNHDQEQQALFNRVYNQAQQDYQTGQGLETLNPSLSQENYQKAQALLKEGEAKLTKNSTEHKQVMTLLAEVESALNQTGNTKTSATKEITPGKNSLLQVAKANEDGLAFGEDGDAVYMITREAISETGKNNGEQTNIITNDNDWSAAKAIAPYQGNLFVLDPKKGVLKFVQGSGGFGKSSYFASSAPNLTQASGMAIDGSVWLFSKTDLIGKYTKGKSDGVEITGLTKPFANITRVVTDIDMEHVYILDQGASRIVQITKQGTFNKEFISPVLATATAFVVSEKNQTIQILSKGKVWEMSL